MTLPKYLAENETRITSIGSQNLPSWAAAYDDPIFNKFSVMEELRERFPSKKIARSDITVLFENNDIYLGFIASMVWGGISSTRPKVKGDKTTTDFYKALSHPQNLIEDSVNTSTMQIAKGDIETPFNNFMPKGDYKIQGIAYSFFTKIFFFIGQANPKIAEKPLIFDKWTKNAFYALLTDTYPDEIPQYFLTKNNKDAVNVRSGKKLTAAYVRYVELMNAWSKEMNIAPDKLEQFVFGYNRKDKNPNNPRLELWNIIQDFNKTN